MEQIRAEGGRAIAQELDVADAHAIAPAIQAAQDEFGPVDILVNNAAVADANYAVRLSLETIDQVIDVNFRAPFLLSAEVARRLMAAKKPGSIVNIASTGAFTFNPKAAAALYSGAKGGLVRLTETLAQEWAPFGINVNAIAPGMFKTEMTDSYIDKVGETVRQQFPRQRFGEPDYLDSTLLFLVSPDSHFVTGACIIADDAQAPR